MEKAPVIVAVSSMKPMRYHEPLAASVSEFFHHILDVAVTVCCGEARFGFVNHDVIGPCVLCDEVKADVGGVRLGVDHEKLVRLEGIYNSRRHKAMSEIRHHYRIVMIGHHCGATLAFLLV